MRPVFLSSCKVFDIDKPRKTNKNPVLVRMLLKLTGLPSRFCETQGTQEDLKMSAQPLWTKNFLFLFISNGFSSFGFQILLPTFPLLISGFGATEAQIGLVVGSFTYSAILIRPFSAMAIKWLGKKSFLLLGIFVCFVAAAGYNFATNVTLALLTRTIHGLGFGISTTLYATLAADIIPASRRGEGMGYYGLCTTISMSIAPILGVELVKSSGFTLLFMVTALCLVISFICIKFFFKPDTLTAVEEKNSDDSLLSKIMERQALFPSFLALLTGICTGGVVSFISLYGKELRIVNIGWFFLFNTLAVFISRILGGRICDRRGYFWVLLPGAFILLIGLIVLSQAKSSVTLIASALLYGFGVGALLPYLQAWMINRVKPERRGLANATFYNTYDLGIGGGSVLLGFIAEKTNYSTMYLYSSLSMIIFILIYVYYELLLKKE
ncbi:MAG: MFS transporter [Peptococcaceae bacterium]|nr:MFS transporter [Peptococcaceae bacterium]MDH7525438.1 MFS transporter [Peptococcaceae bacterium]